MSLLWHINYSQIAIYMCSLSHLRTRLTFTASLCVYVQLTEYNLFFITLMCLARVAEI